MKKHSYRAQTMTNLKLSSLQAQVRDQRLIVGIDVAKTDFVAALMTDNRQVQALVKWRHPEETVRFCQLVTQDLSWSSLEVAMEPSGTYGDPLLSWFNRHGRSIGSALNAATMRRKSMTGYRVYMTRNQRLSSPGCT